MTERGPHRLHRIGIAHLGLDDDALGREHVDRVASSELGQLIALGVAVMSVALRVDGRHHEVEVRRSRRGELADVTQQRVVGQRAVADDEVAPARRSALGGLVPQTLRREVEVVVDGEVVGQLGIGREAQLAARTRVNHPPSLAHSPPARSTTFT
ncbi:MAG: hypothetical protein QOH64_860 [Acidimicrobiaceae bacterium]